MCCSCMDEARKLHDISSTVLLVAMILSGYNNHKTNTCFPSTITLAKECRITRKTVSQAIRTLENKNYITVYRSKVAGGKNFVNQYTINFLKKSDSSKTPADTSPPIADTIINKEPTKKSSKIRKPTRDIQFDISSFLECDEPVIPLTTLDNAS